MKLATSVRKPLLEERTEDGKPLFVVVTLGQAKGVVIGLGEDTPTKDIEFIF
mgnify:CR=1 FL=1